MASTATRASMARVEHKSSPSPALLTARFTALSSSSRTCADVPRRLFVVSTRSSGVA